MQSETNSHAVVVLEAIRRITGLKKTGVVDRLAAMGVLGRRQLFNLWDGKPCTTGTLDALRDARDRLQYERETKRITDEEWRAIATAAIVRLRGDQLQRAAETLHRLAERYAPIPAHQRRSVRIIEPTAVADLEADADAAVEQGKPRRQNGEAGESRGSTPAHPRKAKPA